MSDLRAHARTTVTRWQNARGGSTRTRLAALEVEVQENRRLSRRIAELTDLVTELVVPLARRDQDEVDAILARYRSII